MVDVMSIAKTVERPARRKNPIERQSEIVKTASDIAVAEGLERVTAKRVAEVLGVAPGLVNHYFGAIDDLVAAAFGFAAEAERAGLYGNAFVTSEPREQLRLLMKQLIDPARDAVSLLWLDAWQASRRRPALLNEVVAQMNADSDALGAMIHVGVLTGEFVVIDESGVATRIMALVDGLSIQAATRSRIDYGTVAQLVLRTTETELGLPSGALSS
jgi:AcrR family transcriptional regulator